MLSKRDTFVKHIDPLKTTWVDEEGNIHLDLPMALHVFGFEDTEENRQIVIKEFKKVLEGCGVTKFIHRKQPDSPEFWDQKT